MLTLCECGNEYFLSILYKKELKHITKFYYGYQIIWARAGLPSYKRYLKGQAQASK